MGGRLTGFRLLFRSGALALLVLWPILGHSLPNNVSYDDIVERGWIDIAVYRDFPPFSSRVDGNLVGLDVDIGRRIAEKLGIRAMFREQGAGETVDDDLRNAIWKGHYLGGGIADLMLHVPHDREFALRNNMVVITGAYFQEQLVLVRDREKTGETASLVVYRFEKIGVELDSLPDFYLSGYRGGMVRDNVVHYKTIPEAVDSLRAGEVAAVFANRSQTEAALGGDRDRFAVSPVSGPGLHTNHWDLGMAVNSRSRQLGYAIGDIVDELVSSGEIEALFQTYGLSYTRPKLN